MQLFPRTKSRIRQGSSVFHMVTYLHQVISHRCGSYWVTGTQKKQSRELALDNPINTTLALCIRASLFWEQKKDWVSYPLPSMHHTMVSYCMRRNPGLACLAQLRPLLFSRLGYIILHSIPIPCFPMTPLLQVSDAILNSTQKIRT